MAWKLARRRLSLSTGTPGSEVSSRVSPKVATMPASAVTGTVVPSASEEPSQSIAEPTPNGRRVSWNTREGSNSSGRVSSPPRAIPKAGANAVGR
ncbi:conserved hypothetical protein [Stigmatella aurantiaca DW4/3-1]|uniref:Uncharacterized protein n=1 Tax=Stigmatella aurantiaca (strain DW4/3-1) TaxID=378806 RepID=Q08M48_STIAD|nr:conserved hypothetical protein [Stigmatella aurantiaca DW4/3-1]